MIFKFNLLRFGLLCMLTLLFKANYLTAQTGQEVSLPDVNIIPPPPTEAALGKYGAIPVSKYTGVPNISIPLYELREGSLVVPISLSYHASGIQVEEMASWVGLGWSLNAGGVITRTVVGLPDEKTHGYFDDENWLPDPNNSILNFKGFTPSVNELWYACNSEADYEPDVYSFNFMGFTGTFYIDPYTKNCHIVPQANISIKYVPEKETFIATDYNGIVYEFSYKNLLTKSSSQSSNNSYFSITPGMVYTSTWYLSKVFDPNTADEVYFKYKRLREEYDLRLSNVISKIVCGGTNGQPDKLEFKNKSGIISDGFVLDTICGTNTIISFYTSGREDVMASSGGEQNGCRLDAIKIDYQLGGFGWKKINFDYDYFGSGESDYLSKRLRLDGLTEESSNFSETNSYSFSYYDGLPSRDSNQQDYWGYYNGEGQNDIYNTTVPYDETTNEGYGAILTPDASGKNMKAGTLYKIVYPTKGFTKFEYEPHSYSAYYNSSELINIDPEESSSVGPKMVVRLAYSSETPDKYGVFDLYKDMYVSFNIDDDLMRIIVNGQNNSSGFSVCNSSKTETRWMAKGAYKFRVEKKYEQGGYQDSYSGEASVSFDVEVGPIVREVNQKCGGLRVKKITDFNQSGEIEGSRRFYYKLDEVQNWSSGVRISPIPKYTYFSYILIKDGGTLLTSHWGTAYIRTNINQANQILTKGSTVGYREVKEVFVDGSYTLSKFSTTPDDLYGGYEEVGTLDMGDCNGFAVKPFLSQPTDDKDYLRGQLLAEYFYNKEGNIVKSSSYAYSSNEFYKIPGMRVGFIAKTDVPEEDLSTQRMGYCLYLKSLCTNLLKSKTDTLYFQNGLKTVSKTSYTYNSDYLVSSIGMQNSSGYLENKYLYAKDVAYIPSDLYDLAVVDNMIHKNMIGIPLLSQKYKNGKLIQGKANKFDYFGNKLIKLKYYFEYNTDNLYEKKFEFNYNNSGRLIEQKSSNGILTSYYWGYKGLYPVAKLENVQYSEITSDLSKKLDILQYYENWNSTIVNNFKDLNQNIRNVPLPSSKALITTYTYQPGAGIASQTDPNGVTTYYEYDAMGRLIAIYNNDNDIVKQFSYHYAGELNEDELFSPKKVTFNSQGGGVVPELMIDNYGVIQEPSSPKRTGYVFKGWFTDPDCTDAWDFANDIVTADITLYAKWEIITHTITITKIGNGTVSPSGNVVLNYNSDTTLTFTPSTGYHIKNIIVNGNPIGAVNNYTFTQVTSDQILTVEFEINSYTIFVQRSIDEKGTIESNGGPTVSYGSSITYTFTPNRGYHVEHVIVDGNIRPVLFNKYTFSNVNANHSLQVVFGINSYNISASATTGGSLSPVGNATVNYGGGVTYNFTPNTGYHVKAVTVNGNNISPSESYSFFEVHEDQTLFVEFEINTYTVNFDAQGGSTVINKAAVHNTGITPPTVPTRTGYTFGGWYKESSYTNLWNFNTDKVIANTTLYANWLINTYTVSFNTQDGSALSTHEVDYNSTVMPFIPKRTGYTFGGWYRESACINRWSITDKVTSSITLYAKWIVNTYTVNFDSQGGSRVISKIADYNTPILAPGAPTKTGYKFAGWFKESTLTNAWNFSADKVNANTTLYAKWDANIYTVNFNSQGGSTVSSKTVNYNYTIAAPSAPTFTGYLFEGWFKESTCINAWNFSSDKVTSNIILYAKWSPKTYSVEFISNGIIVKSTMVEYNSLITEPIIPQQIGHKLSWSSSNNNLPFLEWDFSADRVTSNIKLYAIFTPLSYTVTFNSQGGSAVNSKLAVYNSTITVPVEPIREGFIFEGWYKDIRCTSIWNFRTDIVKTNTTLYAKWKVNTYTITATKTGSGTMTPSGNLTVSYGGNLTYTFAASTGYYIKNVVVNGVSKGALSSYTFSNVTANQYISVEFEVNGFISLSTLALRFSNSGEVKTFTISSNINWSISSNETWISVSPSSGSGNKTINVNCSFYRPSRFESYRTGTITISGGGITKTIHIHQGELLEL